MAFEIANTAYLEEITSGNSDFICQIVELFLKQTPGDIELLSTYIQQREWDEVHKQAHYLKPTFVYVGAEHIHQQILTIEQSAKLKERLDTLPDIITDIQRDLKILYKELNDYLKSISK